MTTIRSAYRIATPLEASTPTHPTPLRSTAAAEAVAL